MGYNQQLSASGGSGPLTWSRTGGTLPNGLTLSGSGLISGTPTKVANFSFTVQASDGTSTGSKAFTLKINKK